MIESKIKTIREKREIQTTKYYISYPSQKIIQKEDIIGSDLAI